MRCGLGLSGKNVLIFGAGKLMIYKPEINRMNMEQKHRSLSNSKPMSQNGLASVKGGDNDAKKQYS